MVEVKVDSQKKTVEEVDVLRTQELIQRFSGPVGTICFVVRRPG